LFTDRIKNLKTSFDKEFSILQTQPLSFRERVKNIWRYFSNKPSIDQKFNQLHQEVMSSLARIKDIFHFQ